MALLADAGHNVSDVLALVLAWGAVKLARRAPSARRTYGLRKGTILVSVANAVLLLLAVGGIVTESIHRFAEPAAVSTRIVMLTAGLGIVINTATALMFMRGSKDDLNVRGAFLHMASDAAVSLAVVIGAGLIAVTGISWIDPALGLGIALVILLGTWGLLRDSVDLALDAAPPSIDVDAVRNWLCGLPGVAEVHDLHIWAMSTTETAMTAHLVRPVNPDNDQFLHDICGEMAKRFNIGHVTIQVESGGVATCHLAGADAV
jgi:cobalt-zinc-cadmium efflux system protein